MKSMIESTKEGLSEVTVTVQTGKLELEETTADGRNELAEATIDGKRELEDSLEKAKKELSEIIDHTKQVSMIEGEERKESKFTKAKSDLQKQLLNHYQATSDRMSVRLDIDAAIEDIYEKPKLLLNRENNKKDKHCKMKYKEVPEISEMFQSGNGKMAKTICVVGEAGSGKTALCKKIVHDWCKLKQDGNEEANKNRLSQFEFVFYIRLREVEDRCKIKDLILQCLIEQIESGDKELKELKELLADILKSECCLLLLDGLDEWKHCSKCKRNERIPHVETNWTNCTTLITTRPYKLAELKLSRAQLGNQVQLQGVQSPTKLVQRILNELEKDRQVKRDSNACIFDLRGKCLWHLSCVPIMFVHIVWLWYRDQLNAGMSLSDVYEKIIKERWCEMNDKKKIMDNELPKEFLDSLSKLAFNKLFSTSEDDSIVFGITAGELEKKCKQEALESGIMSCSNKIGERSASYQFVHKTLQEYLSAFYLANCESNLSKHCHQIQEVFRHHRREGALSLRPMFLFLCGINIKAAEVFSESLNELFTEYFERDGCSAEKTRAFQSMILEGYEEAERSRYTKVELCLKHAFLGQTEKHKSVLKLCLDKSKSNLVSLHIQKKSDIASLLQYKKDPTVLDLETCKKLKFVCLINVPYEDINQLNFNGLVGCRIEFSDYKPANKLVSSLLSSDLTCLKTLTLNNLGWECKTEEIFSKLRHIEQLDVTWSKCPPNDSQFDLERLRHLQHLNQLTLKRIAFSDVVNLHMLNLRTLKVSFRTQMRASKLMTSLLAQSDDSLNSNQNGQVLTDVVLENTLMSAEVFRRFVRMMIESRHSLKSSLLNCTIEPEEDVGQLYMELVTPKSVSTDCTTQLLFKKVSMSAGALRGLISMVIQSQNGLDCELLDCTIIPEEDSRQGHVEMENQPVSQTMASQVASTDYTIHIRLRDMTLSAGTFRSIVSVVIQSQHSLDCKLLDCTIETVDDMTQLEIEMETTPHMIAPKPASTDYTTHILLHDMTISAGAFRLLVSMVLQSQHSLDCMLWDCKVETEKEEMENQPYLKMVAPLPVPTDYATHIHLKEVTMSPEAFSCLVSRVILSQRSVDCVVYDCTIEPEEDLRELEEDMKNQPALKMVKFYPVEPSNKWFIEFNVNV
ncbi:uncharacterized protein LOC128239834 [Mya arenaria]|uniref:uncharacterized protein LOC128239834 n=1 Tax=Mya arenaria TaxID=6604 RepID=UPI0022E7332E|nr:uncharacterized protein LOC128239834 [Mya arenaria]